MKIVLIRFEEWIAVCQEAEERNAKSKYVSLPGDISSNALFSKQFWRHVSK
jgi:hypothetical protein